MGPDSNIQMGESKSEQEESCPLVRLSEDELNRQILPADDSGVTTVGEVISELIKLKNPSKIWERSGSGRLCRRSLGGGGGG